MSAFDSVIHRGHRFVKLYVFYVCVLFYILYPFFWLSFLIFLLDYNYSSALFAGCCSLPVMKHAQTICPSVRLF